jgi:RNA polymerase sigma-70 factor (ECF subfamily)
MGIVEKGGRLNRYAAALIKRKASELVGGYGFTESDREDIEQDLWVDLINRESGFDPKKGAETTLIKTVVNNRVATLIEHREARKRDWRTDVCSLDENIEGDNKDGCLRHEVVTKDTYLRTTRESVQIEAECQDRHLDVRRAIQSLSPGLQKIALLLSEMRPIDVARVTGIPRTTINDKRKAIRRIFEAKGIDDWVK